MLVVACTRVFFELIGRLLDLQFRKLFDSVILVLAISGLSQLHDRGLRLMVGRDALPSPRHL